MKRLFLLLLFPALLLGAETEIPLTDQGGGVWGITIADDDGDGVWEVQYSLTPAGPTYGFPNQSNRLDTLWYYAATSSLTASKALTNDLSYYAFTNAPGSTLTNAASANDASTVDYTNGIIAHWFFDGNDALKGDPVPQLSNASNATYEIWVKPNSSIGTLDTIISQSETANSKQFAVYSSVGQGSDDLAFIIYNGGITYAETTGNVIPQDVWTHVVAVFDGGGAANADRAKIFINGSEETLSFSGTIPTVLNTDEALFVGNQGVGVSRHWNGYLSSPVVLCGRDSKYSMTEAAASNRFWQTSWPNPSNYPNSDLADSPIPGGHGWTKWSYDSRNGIWSNTLIHITHDPTFVAGGRVQQVSKEGTAGNLLVANGSGGAAATQVNSLTNGVASYDGDDLMFINDNAKLSFAGGSPDKPFSIAFWVNPDNQSGIDSIYAKEQTGSTREHEVLLNVSNAGDIRFLCAHPNLSAYIGRITAGSQIPTGSWTMIVCTYDGGGASSGMKIYKNDAVQIDNADVNSGSYTGMTDTTSRPRIGSNDLAAWGYNGDMDNLFLFDIELTTNQISDLYSYGHDGNQGP